MAVAAPLGLPDRALQFPLSAGRQPITVLEMQMLFMPGTGTDVKIQLFLGNTAGPVIDFPNWTPSSFTTILTGQARQSGDTVNAVFAGFNAQVVPEPSSCMLIGLSAVGLIISCSPS